MMLLALVLWACGDDGEAEPVDCDPMLEEWCGYDGCEDFATVDDALSFAMVDFEHSELAWVQARGDHVVAGFSDGTSGIMYSHDLESGELIGGHRSSDIASDDAGTSGPSSTVVSAAQGRLQSRSKRP